MPNVTPARFAAKTDEESKFYSIDWREPLGSAVIESAQWESYPNGLAFSDQSVNGTVTRVRIGGGVAGTQYRVRARVTLVGSGEVLEASEGDIPGVSLEVLGFPVVSGGLGGLRDDYGRGPY